jgi:tubulin--tyrosine ligase-like protein 12
MSVTNSFDMIIRLPESGPKIACKYVSSPVLLKIPDIEGDGVKFDVRYVILLRSIRPLKLYLHKIFWLRFANKTFSLKELDDYETHFTVMNYNTYGMQTILFQQFLDYIKSKGIDWEPIYNNIKASVKNMFLLAGKDCPQMCDPYSRAIYGLDVMIEDNLQPKILEINFSPDCTRACKYNPEFFDDIFSTLFLNNPLGVELV